MMVATPSVPDGLLRLQVRRAASLSFRAPVPALGQWTCPGCGRSTRLGMCLTCDGPGLIRALTEQSPAVRVRFLAYLRGWRIPGLDCHMPMLMSVSGDGGGVHREIWFCQSTKSAQCKPCAARHRGRVRAIAATGLARESAYRGFLTLTAPSHIGVHCLRKGCSRSDCSHAKCRCTPPGGVDLAQWNPMCAKNWNHFRTLLLAEYGVKVEFFAGREPQDGKRRKDRIGRGALHMHVLVSSPVVLSKNTLRRLAMRAGFGHSLDLERLRPGSAAAAAYVTKMGKYVSKGCNDRSEVPWRVLVADDDGDLYEMHTAPTYRAWSQSAKWGTSMRELKAAGYERLLSRPACEGIGSEDSWVPAAREGAESPGTAAAAWRGSCPA